MWETGRFEDSLPAEIGEELHDITDQLLQLKDMLTHGCTCGLEVENRRLKRENETMELQMVELRQRICDLEASLSDRENIETPYKQLLGEKDEELATIRQQVKELNDSLREKSTICDTLTRQILQTQVLLSDKTAELIEVQRQSEVHEDNVLKLKQELDKSNNMIKESSEIRGEVSRLSSQVRRWQEQLCSSERRAGSLENELQVARDHCREVDACYREKCVCARALQAELEEAQQRGGRLCDEVRRALDALRLWVRRMRAKNREQEEKIKEQEAHINMLQKRLQERSNTGHSTHNQSCCSKCKCQREKTSSNVSFKYSPRLEERHHDMGRTSGSEMASCSSAPVPPKRMLRKKLPPCEDSCGRIRSLGVQQPVRRDASAGAPSPCCSRRNSLPREPSPGEEVFERVEQLHQALCGGRRRWSARTRALSHHR